MLYNPNVTKQTEEVIFMSEVIFRDIIFVWNLSHLFCLLIYIDLAYVQKDLLTSELPSITIIFEHSNG